MHNPSSVPEMVALYIEEHELVVEQVAQAADKSVDDVKSFLAGTNPMDAHWACVLAHIFKTTPDFWLNMHVQYLKWLAHSRYMNETKRIPALV